MLSLRNLLALSFVTLKYGWILLWCYRHLLEIMEKEYSITVDDKIREDVSTMYNLSQGIRKKGRAEGEEKIILNIYQNNFTFEQTELATSKNIEEIKV